MQRQAEGAQPGEPPRSETEKAPAEVSAPPPAEGAPPEFDRVTDVLGPLEQIVLAADQQIGSIQQQVDAASSEASTRIENRVREAALEQRGRVIKMREELTDAASQLATRFETMLEVLDQAERQLARQGLPAAEAAQARETRVTVTERRRLTISHEGPPPLGGAGGGPPPLLAAEKPEPQRKTGIRGWFRRRRGSAA